MKYMESSIRFSLKNWMLILPLFILTALAYLLGGIGNSAIGIAKAFSSLNSLRDISGTGNILSILTGLLPRLAVSGGIWAFLIQFITVPATYGLVNKSLETGSATLNDLGEAISKNFVKYVLYLIGTIVVGFIVGVGILIVGIILGLLIAALKWVGLLLTIIIGLALLVVLIAFGVLISMWFSAMVVDELDVVAAIKKSIEVVKNNFWTVLGITLLVCVAAAICGGILNLFAVIPLLGAIICSVVPSAQTFIIIVFLLSVYREKNGRINNL